MEKLRKPRTSEHNKKISEANKKVEKTPEQLKLLQENNKKWREDVASGERPPHLPLTGDKHPLKGKNRDQDVKDKIREKMKETLRLKKQKKEEEREKQKLSPCYSSTFTWVRFEGR